MRSQGFFDDPFSFAQQFYKDQALMPKIAEMVVGSLLNNHFMNLYCGRAAQGEIDFVGFNKAIYHFFEVKYQTRVQRNKFSRFTGLLKRQENLLVITKDQFDLHKEPKFVPLPVFLARPFEFLRMN